MSKQTPDITGELLGALRAHTPLTSYLPGGAGAIYESFPAEDTDEPVAVILWVVSDSSSPDRGAISKTWRVQITVKASRPWREAQSAGGVRAMQRVMGRVHDVLDRMDDFHEVGHGSSGGASPEPMEGYLAIANDWLITGHYSQNTYPSQP